MDAIKIATHSSCDTFERSEDETISKFDVATIKLQKWFIL